MEVVLGAVGDGYDDYAGGYGHQHEHGCDYEGLESDASLVSSARGGVLSSEGRAKSAVATAIAPAAITDSAVMVVGTFWLKCIFAVVLIWSVIWSVSMSSASSFASI